MNWILTNVQLPIDSKISDVLWVVDNEVYKGNYFPNDKLFMENPSSDERFGNFFSSEKVEKWMYLPKP